MSQVLFQTLSFIAATSTALLAGIYFIFHNAVMIALTEQNGMIIMTRINQIILNKVFLLIFMLSPLSSLLVISIGLPNGFLTFQSPLLYGALFAIFGCIVTVNFNVPLNNKLDQAEDDKEAIWKEYLTHWGNWNTRRYYISTLACSGIIADFIFF